ncbi:MAG: LamG domain-containing protein, partial [Verrucomicrobiota bacterium]
MLASVSKLLALSSVSVVFFVLNAFGLESVMPTDNVRTYTWWHSGFPTLVDGAPQRRVVETGRYWFMLDTDTLGVARLGSKDTPLNQIPGAELELSIEVNGKSYQYQRSQPISRFYGPRMIESGRFLQRADVRGLIFKAADGTELNAETRFESAAWNDVLGFTFAAEPGLQAITAGDRSFGRVGGGFGLDGTNKLEIPAAEAHTPGAFALAFWVYFPTDFKAQQHSPWLVCYNKHEQAPGNYGLTITPDGTPSARFNLEGGAQSQFSKTPESRHRLRNQQWNHLVISYDNTTYRLFVNGQLALEEKLDATRNAPAGGLTFGGRQDGAEGFDFRGVIDQVHLFNQAIGQPQVTALYKAPAQPLPNLKPKHSWSFRDDIAAQMSQPLEVWHEGKLTMSLKQGERNISVSQALPQSDSVSFLFDPLTFQPVQTSRSGVAAIELGKQQALPVDYDEATGWHQIDLSGITPIPPSGVN